MEEYDTQDFVLDSITHACDLLKVQRENEAIGDTALQYEEEAYKTGVEALSLAVDKQVHHISDYTMTKQLLEKCIELLELVWMPELYCLGRKERTPPSEYYIRRLWRNWTITSVPKSYLYFGDEVWHKQALHLLLIYMLASKLDIDLHEGQVNSHSILSKKYTIIQRCMQESMTYLKATAYFMDMTFCPTADLGPMWAHQHSHPIINGEQNEAASSLLTTFLLKKALRDGIRKSGGWIYREKVVDDAYGTLIKSNIWIRDKTLEDWFYECSGQEQEKQSKLSVIFHTVSKNIKSFIYNLEKLNTMFMPEIVWDRFRTGFKNGIMFTDMKEIKFLPWHECKRTNDCPFHYVDVEYDYVAMNEIIRLSGDSELAWMNIKTPYFDYILNCQNYTAVDKSIVYALFGRGLYPLDGQPPDSYQIGVFLIGSNHSGKSTLLKTLSKLIPKHRVAAISSHSDGEFSLQMCSNAWIVTCTEVTGDFRINQSDLQRMLSEEDVSLNVKYKEHFSGLIEARVFLAGNNVPRIFANKGGSWSRRWTYIPLKKTIGYKAGSEFLEKLLESELPYLLYKFSCAYRWLRSTKYFFNVKYSQEIDIVTPKFYEAKKDAEKEMNPYQQFFFEYTKWIFYDTLTIEERVATPRSQFYVLLSDMEQVWNAWKNMNSSYAKRFSLANDSCSYILGELGIQPNLAHIDGHDVQVLYGIKMDNQMTEEIRNRNKEFCREKLFQRTCHKTNANKKHERDMNEFIERSKNSVGLTRRTHQYLKDWKKRETKIISGAFVGVSNRYSIRLTEEIVDTECLEFSALSLNDGDNISSLAEIVKIEPTASDNPMVLEHGDLSPESSDEERFY